jgi:hypothetical protein
VADDNTPDPKAVTEALSGKAAASPLDNMVKSFTQEHGKETEALTQKAAYTGRATSEENSRYLADRASVAQPSKPDFQKWDKAEPENNPIKSFGSWASTLGILASALTRSPITSALNASASAMKAIRANDLDAYKEHKETWKENMELAQKQSEWEAKQYDRIMTDKSLTHDAKMASVQAKAAELGDTALAHAQAALGYEGAEKMLDSRARLNMMGQTTAAQLRQYNDEHEAKLEELQKLKDRKAEAQQLAGSIITDWQSKNPGQPVPDRVLLSAPGQAERALAAKDAEARNPWKIGGTGVSEGIAQGRAAAYMAGQSLGQGKDTKAAAIAEIHAQRPDLSPQEIAQKGELAVELNKERSSQLIQKGKVRSFEETALANIDQLAKEIQTQRDEGKTDLPVVNALLRQWKEATGQAYGEGVALFGQEAAAELAKLASSATAAGPGGTLADRQEWGSFFARDGAFDQMSNSLRAAREAIGIRRKTTDDAIAGVTGELNGLWDKKDASAGKTGLSAPPADVVGEAKAAIAAGKPKDAIIQRLREHGYSAEGL